MITRDLYECYMSDQQFRFPLLHRNLVLQKFPDHFQVICKCEYQVFRKGEQFLRVQEFLWVAIRL